MNLTAREEDTLSSDVTERGVPEKSEFAAFHQRIRYHIAFLQDKKLIAPDRAAPGIFDLLGVPEGSDIEAIQDAFDDVSDRLRRLQGQHAAAVSEVRTALSMARRIASDPETASAYTSWYRATFLASSPTPPPIVSPPLPPENERIEAITEREPIPAPAVISRDNRVHAAPLKRKLWEPENPRPSTPASVVSKKTSEGIVVCGALGGVLLIAVLLMSGTIPFGGTRLPARGPVTAAVIRPPSRQDPVVALVEPAEKVIRRQQRTEPVAFPIQEQFTKDLPRGRRRITQHGKVGVREITVEVTLQNGKEVARRRVADTMRQSPVPQIVQVGAAAAVNVPPPPAPPRRSRPVSIPAPASASTRVRFCPECGERLSPHQRFCSKNGKPI